MVDEVRDGDRSGGALIDLVGAFDVLDEAYAQSNPALIFALFSGGHDSLTAVSIAQLWAKRRKLWLPVAHVNTGTGIKETRQFVIDTTQERGWPLMELHPPRSYESLVCEMGFPGPGFHDRLAYPRLKGRCFRNLVRLAPPGRVMFVTGIRQEESVRRTEHVERIQVTTDPAVTWAAPIWDWSKIDCNEWIAANGFKRNVVSDLLHISGECLCGAFARKTELGEIAEWFPERAREIRELEDKVEQLGLRACRWGKEPPKVAREQMRAFLTPNDGSFPMLCANCAPQVEQEAGPNAAVADSNTGW